METEQKLSLTPSEIKKKLSEYSVEEPYISKSDYERLMSQGNGEELHRLFEYEMVKFKESKQRKGVIRVLKEYAEVINPMIEDYQEIESNRISHMKPTPLIDINEALSNKEIKVQGMISKLTGILNEKYKEEYTCSECNLSFPTKPGHKPFTCRKCKAQGSFRKTDETFRDFREFEIEETLEFLDRQPERIRIRMIGDLINLDDIKTLQIGQIVDIVGIVDKEKTKTKNDREIYEYYILANEIITSTLRDDDISNEEMEQIIHISKNNPIKILSESIAPDIVGLDSVKKSLLLQMARGEEGNRLNRPMIHILLVGDPSSGKSKLAIRSHEKMPKSIYGSADNMSKAGLCSVTEKDELSGRWSARSGVLSRANKSVLILDEFDKLAKDDLKALHTPMEEGIVTVDKAGAHIELRSSTSILACCNPKNGYFDKSGFSSVSKETNLPEPIISRFDLIFYIDDVINNEKDRLIAKSLFGKRAKNSEILDTNLFRKYINYAKTITPKLEEETEESAEEIYINLRNKSKIAPEKKITSRQLGGLIRLSFASAKLRLSKKVELCDIELAEGLMLDALHSIGFARDLSQIDQASLYTKTTSRKISMNNQLIELIKTQINNGIGKEELLIDFLLSHGFPMSLIDRTLTGLKHDGNILELSGKLTWYGN